jgi:hypothetical protein
MLGGMKASLHRPQFWCGLFLATLALSACSDKYDDAQRKLEAEISRELAARDDIAPADKEAAAAAIAQDFTDIARESAGIQAEVDAENARLEQQLGSAEELAAQDCDRQRLELQALERLRDDPERERLSDAERAALPAEIERMTGELAARCGG